MPQYCFNKVPQTLSMSASIKPSASVQFVQNMCTHPHPIFLNHLLLFYRVLSMGLSFTQGLPRMLRLQCSLPSLCVSFPRDPWHVSLSVFTLFIPSLEAELLRWKNCLFFYKVEPVEVALGSSAEPHVSSPGSCTARKEHGHVPLPRPLPGDCRLLRLVK